MDQRELMTLQHYLKEYGQQAEIFVSQLEMLENGRMEALAAVDALEGMVASEDGTVLLQIGGGASVRAKILEPEKILIAIGAEVVVERSNKEAIDYLKERVMEMEASQKKVAETLDRLRAQMNEINKRLESGYQQSMAEQEQDEGVSFFMFGGLKEKLQAARKRLGSSIQAVASATPAPDRAPAAADAAAPSPTTLSQKAAAPAPSFVEKVKVLLIERELIISEKDVSEALSELEMTLLESDVALPATDAIIANVRKGLVGKHRKIGESIDALVVGALRTALLEVLGNGFDLLDYIRTHPHPVKILFTGVNGTGKTTTVAKIGYYLKNQGFTVVIGAGDTYRAGAIEQIGVHAERLGIKIIQHQEGGDPSAVLFDTVQYAVSHKIDVVLADTAGRFHNKANLMSQLDKIKRVMKPDLVVYVDEAVAGNDAVTRAFEFDKTVGADAVVLTKADMDSRGGAAISIAHTIGKPLMFLGTGQAYDDIVPFEPASVVGELLEGGS
jgi:fused signal recognition particle receptor